MLKKIEKFCIKKFKMLLITVGSLFIVTLMIFLFVGNGVSSEGSINRIRKIALNNDNVTWVWHDNYLTNDEQKIKVNIDNSGELTIATSIITSYAYIYMIYYPESNKIKVALFNNSVTDYYDYNFIVKYEYDYKIFGGNTISTAEGVAKVYSGGKELKKSDHTSDFVNIIPALISFVENAGFLMGRNTKSCLPTLFISLLALELSAGICIIIIKVRKKEDDISNDQLVDSVIDERVGND